MFRSIALLASLISAAAFSPSTRVARGSALKMAYDGVGALPPVGFWDPLGLSEGKDEATLALYREAELKHGRVSMLAVVGYLAQSYGHFPGELDGIPFSDIPNGVAAIGVVPSLGWLQITASIGYWELVGWEDRRASDAAGDFGFGTNFFSEAEREKQQFQLKELQNGRLAMLAIMELITHDLAKPAGESLFTLHHF